MKTVHLAAFAAGVGLMVLVALGALVMGSGGEGAGQPAGVGLMVLIPAAMAVLLWLARRQLSSQAVAMSASHRAHVLGALGVYTLFALGIQTFIAWKFVQAEPMAGDRETLIRIVVALIGVAMGVRGNFFAKLDPPSGPDAPEAAVWTRTALRMGWVLMLTGLTLAVCALVLPMRPLFVVMIATLPIIMGLSVFQQRRLRAGRV